jgi:hypothetical protein
MWCFFTSLKVSQAKSKICLYYTSKCSKAFSIANRVSWSKATALESLSENLRTRREKKFERKNRELIDDEMCIATRR